MFRRGSVGVPSMSRCSIDPSPSLCRPGVEFGRRDRRSVAGCACESEQADGNGPCAFQKRKERRCKAKDPEKGKPGGLVDEGAISIGVVRLGLPRYAWCYGNPGSLLVKRDVRSEGIGAE